MSAQQLVQRSPLWNDIAIALFFVIDIFLSIANASGSGIAGLVADAPSNAENAAREPAPFPSDSAL
jgi:hypothetical protein